MRNSESSRPAWEVWQVLTQAACLDPTGIVVLEVDRWIYLEGTFPAAWDKERAEGLVTALPYVTGVTNNLSVES